MPDAAGIAAALICAALFTGAILSFLRAHEGPYQEKVYSVDKRPIPVRIRAYLARRPR